MFSAWAATASSYLSWILISKNSSTCSVGHISMASQAIRSQTCTQILHPMHSSNRICTFGMTTLIPFDVSRGVSSIQSTGQKLTHASHPVQLSGMTTANSFGFFFLRVILAGASGMIRVGFAFLGSYATDQYSRKKAQIHRMFPISFQPFVFFSCLFVGFAQEMHRGRS